jgi:broad specificity phosphatase PhoE
VAWLLLAIGAVVVQPALADEAFTPSTAIFVRHAEKKAAPADDPSLTADGLKRAQRLASLLRDAGVKGIVTSQFKRTQETAKPLADALGIAPTIVSLESDPSGPGGLKLQSLQDALQELQAHPGAAVLFVGHSNSVPEMIKLLGGDSIPEIAETDFDNLFIVTVYADKKAKVFRLKY